MNLLVDNELIGVMIDRFGKRIRLIKVDDEHFKITVKVAVSPQFMGWILALGNQVKITGPDDVVELIKEKVEAIYQKYQS